MSPKNPVFLGWNPNDTRTILSRLVPHLTGRFGIVMSISANLFELFYGKTMQIATLGAFSSLSILLFCSCSNSSGTADIPEMTPAVSQASQLQSPKKNPQPAEVLLQSQNLFDTQESENSQFAGDPLLQSQESNFDPVSTETGLMLEQTDFSQEIIPSAK
jgi:hypothetical protein